MNENKHGLIRSSRFERHPLLTMCLVVVFLILSLDAMSAKLYESIKGHAFYKRLDSVTNSFRRESSVFHHDLAPNQQSHVRWGNHTYDMRTNSLGFRDKANRGVSLLPDKYRILFIGDSFTEGVGVDYQDTFVGLVDSELSKKGIEVLNAGVVSYSPIIYWRKIKYLLEDVGLRFNEVVVFIDNSDIPDEVQRYDLDERENVASLRAGDSSEGKKAGGVSPGGLGKLFFKIESFLRRNTILGCYVVDKLRARVGLDLRNVDEAFLWTLNGDSYKKYGERGLKKCDFYMEKLRELLDQYGVRLMVAVYPWPQQVSYGDLNSIQVSHWRDWCRLRQVPFLNYFPYFITGETQAKAKKGILENYIVGDGHFTKKGHRLIAEGFLDFYKKMPAQKP